MPRSGGSATPAWRDKGLGQGRTAQLGSEHLSGSWPPPPSPPSGHSSHPPDGSDRVQLYKTRRTWGPTRSRRACADQGVRGHLGPRSRTGCRDCQAAEREGMPRVDLFAMGERGEAHREGNIPPAKSDRPSGRRSVLFLPTRQTPQHTARRVALNAERSGEHAQNNTHSVRELSKRAGARTSKSVACANIPQQQQQEIHPSK